MTSTEKIPGYKARILIANIYHFLKEEYYFMRANNDAIYDLTPLSNIVKRTAEATGVSELTVKNILDDENSSVSAQQNITDLTQDSEEEESI